MEKFITVQSFFTRFFLYQMWIIILLKGVIVRNT